MLRPALFSIAAVAAAMTAAAQGESSDPDPMGDRMDKGGGAPFVQFSFNAGFDFNTAYIGAFYNTTTLSTPVSARADIGDFRFSVTGAWVQIEGPGGVLADGVIVGDGLGAGAIETNSGFGDLTLGVNYNVPTAITGPLLLQLQGRVKLPTADEDRGLGTGETDVGIAADFAYPIGSFTPFTTLGVRFRGDPEGVELNNTFSASVGGAYTFRNGLALLGSYDFRQATVDTAPTSNELFGAVSGRFNRELRWTLYGSVGLSDGAPDGGAGVQLSYRPGA